MNFFQNLTQQFGVGRTFLLSLPLLLILLGLTACTNSEDFANPLDAENLRTSGAPDGLTLYPGDEQIRLTWTDTGQAGIKAYRIYRRSISNSDEPFEVVGTVNAPASEFIDTHNLENDRLDDFGNVLAYEYRISYIDINDVETPDPANLPQTGDGELMRIWKTASATPSIKPPAPDVTIGEPVDLAVNLFWEDYVFPADFSIFRISIAPDRGEGESLIFRQAAEISRESGTLYYLDGNFREDGTKKTYRIAAIDRFGVEAVTIVAAESPNLPPKSPTNFAVFCYPSSLFTVRYDSVLQWDANIEPDLEGYQIYTINNDMEFIPRPAVKKGETTLTIIGEEPVVIAETPYLRPYFIVAYDNTPRPDGMIDASERVEAAVLANFTLFDPLPSEPSEPVAPPPSGPRAR